MLNCWGIPTASTSNLGSPPTGHRSCSSGQHSLMARPARSWSASSGPAPSAPSPKQKPSSTTRPGPRTASGSFTTSRAARPAEPDPVGGGRWVRSAGRAPSRNGAAGGVHARVLARRHPNRLRMLRRGRGHRRRDVPDERRRHRRRGRSAIACSCASTEDREDVSSMRARRFDRWWTATGEGLTKYWRSDAGRSGRRLGSGRILAGQAGPATENVARPESAAPPFLARSPTGTDAERSAVSRGRGHEATVATGAMAGSECRRAGRRR
jgi:hypothetical protein